MFKVYTLMDGMVGDLFATHNESDAHVVMNALTDDYEVPNPPVEVTIVMVEDEEHIPAGEVGPEALLVREHTITPW